MVEGFFSIWPSFYLFEMKFSLRYIADILGVACNSWLPQAMGPKGLPITFCSSTTSYLSPYSKLVKGKRAPQANAV
jgi:hypothetical protein